MDASASSKSGPINSKEYDFFSKIDGNEYSMPSHQNNTVIKYTKLPDFDTRVTWLSPHYYTLQPRIRRMITLDDDDAINTKSSLKSTVADPPKVMAANHTKRKIVTISEDDQLGVYHRIVKSKTPSTIRTSTRAVEADLKPEKPTSNRTTTRLVYSSNNTKETKPSAKSNSAFNKEKNLNQNKKIKVPPFSSTENSRMKQVREKESTRNSRNTIQSKQNSKNLITSNESVKEMTRIKNILYDNLKTNASNKKAAEKPRLTRSPPPRIKNQNKISIKEMSSSNCKRLTIKVPLEDNIIKPRLSEIESKSILKIETQKVETIDRGDNTDTNIQQKNANVGTESIRLEDRMTATDFETKALCKFQTNTEMESINEIFDSLEIPNVTLTKEKPEIKTKMLDLCTTPQALPIETSCKNNVTPDDISFCQNAYVFSRATVTYTTRQKINFHVVDRNEDISCNNSPTPLDYPLNIVSVIKNELKNRDKRDKNSHIEHNTNRKENNMNSDRLNELKSINCSYVINNVMKPSDVISNMRVNTGLLQNDYIYEQFQKELNFIDSFFESLQYLESCSLSDKSFCENKVGSLVNNAVSFDSTFNVKNLEYDSVMSNLENVTNVDDNETMASKSLCLLNLLIRDEQRRAKNLLFVLKMREDALKDYTKSQLLWLEKKKKQDNTDISTLKKKQRGALLKLQHECGEMQRMRKALLTLSEKRKLALMKTKKNIELKLKNDVSVENIILNKKKFKRSALADRNPIPLKCFELSSSGCEDSNNSRHISDAASIAADPEALVNVKSAEKYVQTGDLLCTYTKHQSSDIAAENFVAVDGGYLNILFRDIMLPQIFSSGKEYEVNEEALKNILSNATKQSNSIAESKAVEKIVEQCKSRELDTSSPSTARSLVEEFDQYYRGLATDDNSTPNSPVPDEDCHSEKVLELRDVCVQSDMNVTHTDCHSDVPCSVESVLSSDVKILDNDELYMCDALTLEYAIDNDPSSCNTQPQTGPLTMPVGAAAVTESPPPDVPSRLQIQSHSSSNSDTDSEIMQYTQNQSASILANLSTPVQYEAEELRRQQLAIEREIKALEQQQCRLLVVREIPDKPPPPYTPPTETKPKPPRKFALDEDSVKRIEEYMETEGTSVTFEDHQESDPFVLFLNNYCEESLVRHKNDQSDKPWDACNLLPKKPQVDAHKIVENTTKEIMDVLTGAPPMSVSGVSSRRCDHIDHILFAEWRRCEPEWTALHVDETFVKNQLFDSIFQKILTETVDQYKETVATTD